MNESLIETLKELVKSNGNQAAVILNAIIEALEQSGGSSIQGQAGQVAVCDGEGGAAGSSELTIGNSALTVDGIIVARGDISSDGNISSGGKVVSRGDTVSEGNIVASGDISSDGSISSGGKVVSKGDIVARYGALISGSGEGIAGEIHLFDSMRREWTITVDDGQLTCTQVV